jgi:hypothetical protein
MKYLSLSLIALACLAFSGCDYAPVDPTFSGSATFIVEIVNGASSTTFYVNRRQGRQQLVGDEMTGVPPGSFNDDELSAFHGSNGDSFDFYFYNDKKTWIDPSKPAPNAVLDHGACILRNANKILLLDRVVRFNPETLEIHCENWD